MIIIIKKFKRYTFGEEVGNSITHGVMAVLALFSIPFSAIWCYRDGDLTYAISASIFTISLFLMFLGSTLYHAMDYESKHKYIFKILDHSFIYVAIAGSYTPIALCFIKGWQGILVVVIQWLVVILGILYKSLSKKSIPVLSLSIYLIMGWTAIAFIPLFIAKGGVWLNTMILLGGLFYSIGTFFYAKNNVKYNHMVWHLFVCFGAISHFIAIIFFM